MDDGGLALQSFEAGPIGFGRAARKNAELALNKYLQTQQAREAGFNVPHTVLAYTASDVFVFSAAQSFPIILKSSVPVLDGRKHCAGNGFVNRVELERAVAAWSDASPLTVPCCRKWRGRFGLQPEGVRAWSAHRRLRMMNPQGSGSSACVSQPVSSDANKSSAHGRTDGGGCSWSNSFATRREFLVR